MPTLPRPPHEARELAEGFGTDARRYDRTRPSYESGLVERVVHSVGPGPAVLDVGSGTGILSRQLETAGAHVLGVEPDERMATWARRTGQHVEIAPIETWDDAGRTFDAVTAGQAWHWVDPTVGAARAAAVLAPGGRFAAFWNVFDPPAGLAQAFAATYREVLPDAGPLGRVQPPLDTYAPILTATTDGLTATGWFSSPEQWHAGWDQDYTRDEWLELLPTFGGHGRFAAQTLQRLQDGIGRAIDATGGSVTMRYTTVVVTAVRHRDTAAGVRG